MLQGKSEEQAINEILATGKSKAEAIVLAPQKIIPGNRPSNTLYFQKSTPRSIGALIALYEHKVAAQGMIWGVNSFDQWGVELGKQLGDKVLGALESTDKGNDFDGSTNGLIQAFHQMQGLL